MMDANGNKEDKYFNQFITDTELNDIFPYLNSDLDSQSTYRHGQQQIYYILVSDEVLPASIKAGHTTYGYPFISDHKGAHMDISEDQIFGANSLDPTPPAVRK